MSDDREVILVRHGQSETNQTDTFQAGDQSRSDPLTDLGRRQAERLAERLAGLPVELTISSSYLRARTTAATIADAVGSPHVVPVREGDSWVDLPADDPRLAGRASLLREIDVPSELEGLRFSDPRAREVQRAALAVAEEPDGHHSDEENLHDLWRRARDIRHYLESRTERLLVVVAHGGILKVWLAHLMFSAVPGLDTAQQLAAYRGFSQLGWWDNCGALSVRYSPASGWMWLMTDVAHLGPKYLSFMPGVEEVEEPPKDTGGEYLG